MQDSPVSTTRKIIFVEQVSALIGKSVSTIQTAATCKKYLHTIPRPFKMPGSRRNCWYEDDVLAWREKNYKPVVAVPDEERRRRGRPTKKEAVSRLRMEAAQ